MKRGVIDQFESPGICRMITVVLISRGESVMSSGARPSILIKASADKSAV